MISQYSNNTAYSFAKNCTAASQKGIIKKILSNNWLDFLQKSGTLDQTDPLIGKKISEMKDHKSETIL